MDDLPTELRVFAEFSFSSAWAVGILHSPGEPAERHLRLWRLYSSIVLF